MIDKHSEIYVFRILDAAINRAGEGLRVVEDFARMVLQDALLSQQLKQLRHDLTSATSSINSDKRIAARDAVGDVGTSLETTSEYKRSLNSATNVEQNPKQRDTNPADGGLVQANFSRAQQAIRTIEEFAKLMNPELAKQVERIRYRTYTVEKAVLTTQVSIQRLAGANLYVLIDGHGDIETLIPDLINAGVGLIQLRNKSLSDQQLVDQGRQIANLTQGTSTLWIMNDRADLAVAANADGVHLGQDDLNVSDARRIVGAAKIIGVSTHSLPQAQQAVLDGANYIGVGPVFPSQTKQFDAFVGLDLLTDVAGAITLPSYAIGGINHDNVDQVVQTGFQRIAVGAAVTESNSPGGQAARLVQALNA